ncbi:MAG: vault protein inter-alpha-trypsin protein, partial [Phycisphaerales bacterium]|nr:vault protein inter-alpha-trypsin protein [Phycisphaerales bacterium]
SEDAIVAKADKESHGDTRVFCFGIGTDVNTHLLDRIAADTRAFSQYVLPEEDIEVKVSNFYTKIKEPVLSDVKLAFTGNDIHVSQLYPGQMPDLFKGEVLVAFGRYSGKGPAAVKVTGTLNGESQTFATDVNFAEHDTTNAFIPRLWATRRVGYLLDEIRLHGESKELKDEVTRLAREHGIVTPYTAYLILEDEQRRNVPLARQSFRELGADEGVRRGAEDRLRQVYNEAQSESARTGKKALDASRDAFDLRNGENLDAVAQAGQNSSLAKASASTPHFGAAGAANGPAQAAPGTQPAYNYGYRQAQNYTQQARVLRGRAFYQNGNTWTDSTAQNRKDLKQKQIQFNSDDYFALLKQHPEAAEWLALGNEVDLVIDDTLYQVR